MRISDWSSDVCSSDLPILRVRPQMFSRHRKPRSAPVDPLLGKPASFGLHRYIQGSSNLFEENRLLKFAIVGLFGITAVLGEVIYSTDQKERTVVDRQVLVEGRSVAVGEGLGGRRHINKK